MIVILVHFFAVLQIRCREYYMSELISHPLITDQFQCQNLEISFWFKIQELPQAPSIVLFALLDQNEQSTPSITLFLNVQFSIKYLNIENHFEMQILLHEWYHFLITEQQSDVYDQLKFIIENSISSETIIQNQTRSTNIQCRSEFCQTQIVFTKIQILNEFDHRKIQVACKPGCRICEQNNLFNCLACDSNRVIQTIDCQCLPFVVQESQIQCLSRYSWVYLVHPSIIDVLYTDQIPLLNILFFEQKFVYNEISFKTCRQCISYIFNMLKELDYIGEIHIIIYYSLVVPHCEVQSQQLNFSLSVVKLQESKKSNGGKKIDTSSEVSKTILFTKFHKQSTIKSNNQQLLLEISEEAITIQSNVILIEAMQNLKLNLIGHNSSKVDTSIQIIYLTDYILKDIILDSFYQINLNYSGNIRLTINSLILQNISLISYNLINVFESLSLMLKVNTLVINQCIFQNSSLFQNNINQLIYNNITIMNSIFKQSSLLQARILQGNGMRIVNCSFENSVIINQIYDLWISQLSITKSSFIDSSIILTYESAVILLNHLDIKIVGSNAVAYLFHLKNCAFIEIIDLHVSAHGQLLVIYIDQNLNCLIDNLDIYESQFYGIGNIILIQSSNVVLCFSKFSSIETKAISIIDFPTQDQQQVINIVNLEISNITLICEVDTNLIRIDIGGNKHNSDIYIEQLNITEIMVPSVFRRQFYIYVNSQTLTLKNSQLQNSNQSQFNGYLEVQAISVMLINLFCKLSGNRQEMNIGMFIQIHSANIILKNSQFYNIQQILLCALPQFSVCIVESNTIITTLYINGSFQIWFYEFNGVYFYRNYIEQHQRKQYCLAFEWVHAIEITDNTFITLSQQIIFAKVLFALLENNTIVGIDKGFLSSCEYPYLMAFYGGHQIYIDILIISKVWANYFYMVDQTEIHFSNISGLHTHYQGNLINIKSDQCKINYILVTSLSIMNMTLGFTEYCRHTSQEEINNEVCIQYLQHCSKQLIQDNTLFSLTSPKLRQILFYRLVVIKCKGTILKLFPSMQAQITLTESAFISNICGEYCILVEPTNKQLERLLIMQTVNNSIAWSTYVINSTYSILPIFYIYPQDTENLVFNQNHVQQTLSHLKYQITLSLDLGQSFFRNYLSNFENLEFQIAIRNKVKKHIYIPSGISFRNYSIFDFNQNIYLEISLNMHFKIQQPINYLLSDNKISTNVPCNLKYNQSEGSEEIAYNINEQNWEGFQVVSEADTIIQFNTSCQFDNSTGNSLRYTSLIFYGKVLKCQFGQIQRNLICEPCSIEQQQYSVERKSTYCKIINTNIMKSVKYGMIELQRGFWRPNIYNDDIANCNEYQDSCLGGFGVRDKLCEYPYLGPLCSECDLFRQYSENTYFKDQLQLCNECSLHQLRIQIYIVLQNILLQSLIILIISQSFTKLIRERIIISVTLRFMTPLKQHKGVVLICFLIIQTQLLAQMTNLNFYSIFKIRFNLDILSFTSDAAINIINCLFSQYFNINLWIYVRQFIILIYYMYVYNTYLIIYFALLKFNSQAYKPQHIIISLICIYRYFVIDYTAQLLQVIQPIQISGIYWVQTFMQLQYTNSHLLYSIFIFIPYLLLITLILQAFLIFKIKVQQPSRKLKYYIYSFLTHKFKSKYWFIEYLSVMQAILMLVIMNYQKNKEWIGFFLMVFVGQLYFVILNHLNPYCNKYLNKISARLAQLLNFQLTFYIFSHHYSWFSILNQVLYGIIYIYLIALISIKATRSVIKWVYLERKEIHVSIYQKLRVVAREKRRQKRIDIQVSHL